MHKFKVGDKVVAASQKGSECWRGLVVTAYWREGSCYTCRVTDEKSEWFDSEGAFYEDDLSLVVEKPKRDYVADHARRTLRKAGLTKEQAAQFVQNMQTIGTGEHTLSSISRKLPMPLGEFVGSAFYWANSPQGQDYWEKIDDEISEKGL